MANQAQVLYTLACGHVINGSIHTRNGKRCNICKTVQLITGVHTFEWHATCLNCTWGRWTALDPNAANQAIWFHSQRYPAHAVSVIYEERSIAKKVLKDMVNNGLVSEPRTASNS